MAVTTTTVFDDSVKALYMKDFKIAVYPTRVWDQFTKRKQIMDGERGSSANFVIYEGLAPQTSELDQESDVTPITGSDNEVSVSIAEYGADVRVSKRLKATAYTDVHKAAAQQIARNVSDSLELVCRAVYIGGGRVYRAAARAALTSATAAHTLTYSTLLTVDQLCNNLLVPEVKGGNRAAVIPPCLKQSVCSDSDFKLLAEYNGGMSKAGNMYVAEVGQLAGFRFFVSPWGKTYWGGGLATQTATTISAAVAAGDTTVSFTSDTGVAVKPVTLTALNSPKSVDNWAVAG